MDGTVSDRPLPTHQRAGANASLRGLEDGLLPIHRAVGPDHHKVITAFIESGPAQASVIDEPDDKHNGITLLCRAAAAGSMATAQVLIQSKLVDVEAEDWSVGRWRHGVRDGALLTAIPDSPGMTSLLSITVTLGQCVAALNQLELVAIIPPATRTARTQLSSSPRLTPSFGSAQAGACIRFFIEGGVHGASNGFSGRGGGGAH